MRINFQQGIINYPRIGPVQSFLTRTGSFVTLSATNGVTDVAFTHGDSNYLLSETTTVSNAWGPIAVSTDTWLYWDIDRKTGARTFGITTLEPAFTGPKPASPSNGKHWFDSLTKKMYVAQTGVWREVIRVFAAKVNDTTFTPLGSGVPGATFAGTQVGLTGTTVGVGRIIFDGTGAPIRKANGQLFTTEDDFFINGSPINAVRLESSILLVTADENIAKYQVVRLTQNGNVLLAEYDDQGETVVAMTTEDILLADTGVVVLQGVITNPDWAWDTINAPLWVTTAGLLSESDPHVTDSLTYPKARNPVARVISATSIVFDQGLGGKGEKGDAGSNTLAALGDVTLTTPITNHLLTFNGTEWVNAPPPATVAALNDLTDVTISTPLVNQVLLFNGTQWVNGEAQAPAVFIGDTPPDPETGIQFWWHSTELNLYVLYNDQWVAAVPTGGGGAVTDLTQTANTFQKMQTVAPTVLVDAATITIDGLDSNNFELTMTDAFASRLIANPTNLSPGQVVNLRVRQSALGSKTVTFGNIWKFPNGIVYEPTPDPDSIDFISAYYDSTYNMLLCSVTRELM